MKNKLTRLVIQVPYKRAGNVIYQQEVNFEVYRNEEEYSLVPLLPPDELEIANLPQSLDFVLRDGKPVSLRGKQDGNLHVIEEAVAKLREREMLA